MARRSGVCGAAFTKVGLALSVLAASCGGGSKQTGGDGGPSSACRNSLECRVPQVCDPSIAMCVDCVTANDCPAMNDCTARKCVPYVTCASSLDCPTTEVCNAASSRCVACVTDADCADATKICVANACQVKCMSDRTCTPLGMLCDPTTGSCVRCVTSKDCGSGQYCQGGACLTAVCTPGGTACMLNAVATCNAVGDGYSGTAVPCDPKTCVMSASGAACADTTGGAGTSGGAGSGGATGAGGGTGSGGAAAGGTTGSAGAAAGGTTGSAGAAAGGTTGSAGAGGAGGCGLIIDDMEADTGLICKGDGRMGRWFNYNDGALATVQTPPTGTFPLLPEHIVPARGTSQFAMHTSGTYTSYLAIGCSLNGPDTASTAFNQPYDASGFTGIRFYAKGTAATTALQAIVQSEETESTTYGGTCTAASCIGNRVNITLDPASWTLYQIPFSMLTGGSATFVAKHAWSVEFLAYNNLGVSSLSADFWIDDLSFY